MIVVPIVRGPYGDGRGAGVGLTWLSWCLGGMPGCGLRLLSCNGRRL